MLSTNDFLIVVYNFLEVGSRYRSDLVDLFGTPDGTRKGYIGSIDKPLRWDWGETGFRKMMSIAYALAGQEPSSFERYFLSNIFRKENIIQSMIKNKIIDSSPQMIYVFKHSSKKIPAMTAKIHDISWIQKRIWITFQPNRYFLLDPLTWKEFWQELFTGGRENSKKWFDNWSRSWNMPRPRLSQIEQMLHSGFSQDQYHIIPSKLLLENIKRKIDPISHELSTCFIKDIADVRKRLKLRVPTDNQAFWGILSDFIGRTQVRGAVELEHDKMKYSITDIPANTISEDSLVYKQEIGAAKAICQALLDIFDEDYLKIEFSAGTTKSILDSVFLRRAAKVSMIAQDYEKKYGETDFDYQLDLSPLSSKHPSLRTKILFDLTAGLWNKSIAKSEEEFVEQWKHNLIELPKRNSDLYTVWHYGLLSEIKDGSYKGAEIGDYLKSTTKMDVMKYQEHSIRDSHFLPRLILLPFFRDSEIRLEKELEWISSNQSIKIRRSRLYKSLRELLERLKA